MEEVAILRRKVNRLENMIYNINNKIGLILEKFLNHRTNQVAGIRQILQGEEDICLSLATQLKACIISNKATKRVKTNVGGTTAHVQQKSTEFASIRPRRAIRSRPSASNNDARNQLEQPLGAGPANPLASEIGDDGQPRFRTVIKAERIDEEFLSEGPDMDPEAHDSEPDSENSDYEPGEDESDDDDNDMGRASDPDFLPQTSAATATGSVLLRVAKRKPLKLSRTYSSIQEARALLKSERRWVMNTTSRTSLGTKMYYVCKGYHKCPVKMELHVDEETGAVLEYVASEPVEHQHAPKNDKRRLGGLSDDIRQVAEDIYFEGITTESAMYAELMKRGVPEFPRFKLKTVLKNLRRRKFGDLSFMRTAKKGNANLKTKNKPLSTREDSGDRDGYGGQEQSPELT